MEFPSSVSVKTSYVIQYLFVMLNKCNFDLYINIKVL